MTTSTTTNVNNETTSTVEATEMSFYQRHQNKIKIGLSAFALIGVCTYAYVSLFGDKGGDTPESSEGDSETTETTEADLQEIA